MLINNKTNRTLDIQVAAESSQTLWTTSIAADSSSGKDFSDSDAPFTVTGRWSADPPLQYNFVLGDLGGSHSVPDNDSTVVITQCWPGFSANV